MSPSSPGAGPAASAPATPLEDPILPLLLQTIREEGLPDFAAAERIGLPPPTLEAWKRAHPPLIYQFRAARAEYRSFFLTALRVAATAEGGRHWRAAAWILEHAFAETHGRTIDERRYSSGYLDRERQGDDAILREYHERLAREAAPTPPAKPRPVTPTPPSREATPPKPLPKSQNPSPRPGAAKPESAPPPGPPASENPSQVLPNSQNPTAPLPSSGTTLQPVPNAHSPVSPTPADPSQNSQNSAPQSGEASSLLQPEPASSQLPPTSETPSQVSQNSQNPISAKSEPAPPAVVQTVQSVLSVQTVCPDTPSTNPSQNSQNPSSRERPWEVARNRRIQRHAERVERHHTSPRP